MILKTNLVLTIAVGLLTAITLDAQPVSPTRVSVTAADEVAGRDATGRRSHGKRSNAPGAAAVGRASLSVGSRSGSSNSGPGVGNGLSMRAPGDLSYGGGPVVTYAQSHAIYLNPVTVFAPNGVCTISSCWGDPEGFLKDLATSDFIHITDQYVKATADNRYTVGKSAMIPYAATDSPLSDSDILAKVHAVAASTGQTGYGHIYHVFLPPGQDACQSTGVCFSNALCAYHGSADFFDIGHVLYSVEPDQIGFNCAVAPGSPNGARVDSTNNVLSHEMFEIITDPDFTAWSNTTTLDLLGEEIGDECSFINSNSLFDVPTFRIGKKDYAVQREYDNSQHTCATKPM